ncbi:MAG TPA: hypothetical protein VFG50_02870, partial [Rhodothermales bacterium]|nr:hypothetical protein [Rhodothermales bacterium]
MKHLRYVRFCFALILPFVALAWTAPSAAAQAANPAVVDAGSGSLLEDPFVKSEVREGLDLLYNLKFEQADRHFERIAQ